MGQWCHGFFLGYSLFTFSVFLVIRFLVGRFFLLVFSFPRRHLSQLQQLCYWPLYPQGTRHVSELRRWGIFDVSCLFHSVAFSHDETDFGLGGADGLLGSVISDKPTKNNEGAFHNRNVCRVFLAKSILPRNMNIRECKFGITSDKATSLRSHCDRCSRKIGVLATDCHRSGVTLCRLFERDERARERRAGRSLVVATAV